MSSHRSNLVDISVQLHHATLKAILVSDDGDRDNGVWLPKSQVEYDEDSQVGSIIEVTLPEKLAIEKGLV